MKAQNQILLDRCMTEPLNMAVISSAPSVLETADHDQHARRPTVQDSSSMCLSCAEDGTAASASSFFSFSFWLYSQGRHICVLNGSPPSFYLLFHSLCFFFLPCFCLSSVFISFLCTKPRLHLLQQPTSGQRATDRPLHRHFLFQHSQNCDAVFTKTCTFLCCVPV